MQKQSKCDLLSALKLKLLLFPGLLNVSGLNVYTMFGIIGVNTLEK